MNYCIVGGHLYIDMTMDPDTPEFADKCDELAARINMVKDQQLQQQQQQQQRQQQQQQQEQQQHGEGREENSG